MHGSKRVLCLLLLLATLLVGSNWAITVNPNGYELTIAVSDKVASVDGTNSNAIQVFLQGIQTTMTSLSQRLFVATDYKMYIQKVNILLPRGWTGVTGSTITYTATYLNADVRVEETMTDAGDLVTTPRTKNSKPCGSPGEYIILPPQFFVDANNAYTNMFGDKAKVLLHEFAHFRYGVFEEYGFVDESSDNGDLFPYAFTNNQGNPQLTGCNNTEIQGAVYDSSKSSATYFTPCNITDYYTNPNCRFWPNMTATTGPTTSLMFMQFLPTATAFCDSTNHDPTAPNKQNYWCRNRSVKSVMNFHPDLNGKSAQPTNTNTVPTFIILTPSPQTIFVVLDVSTHTLSDSTVFNGIKSQLQTWVSSVVTASRNSYVGIATMGGSTANINGYLGNYLNIVQLPTGINNSTNQQNLANQINSIVRGGNGLLLEKAVLDAADILTPFTHQSGSIILLVKLNDATSTANMNVEANAAYLLNSRNIRLVTVEYGTNTVLQRVTRLTDGNYFNVNSTNYANTFASALTQVNTLVQQTPYQSLRFQLMSNATSVTQTSGSAGYFATSWPGSKAEVNFFIPTAFSTSSFNIAIYTRSNLNSGVYTANYTMSSSQFSQSYTSWNGLYNVYTFTIQPLSPTTATYIYNYAITTNGGVTISGFVEAVEILSSAAALYVGGGGPPTGKPVEIEVYTSGNNGVLTMSTIPDDQSFLIYATIMKGYGITTSVNSVAATILYPDLVTTATAYLRDNGQYPDLLANDRIYSGYYTPPAVSGSNTYRISVRVDGVRTSVTNPPYPQPSSAFSSCMPVAQDSYCCGDQIALPGQTTWFQRILTYATSLTVTSAPSFQAKPIRVMDLSVASVAPDGMSATFTWTAVANSYDTPTTPVASYRLYYSYVTSNLIDPNYGTIPSPAPPMVNAGDILSGSLTPLAPGSVQSVTIQLNRPSSSPPPLYFTIVSTSTSSIVSYPAPMVYITGTGTVLPSTAAPTTTVNPTTSTPTTTRTTTTTMSTTRASTALLGISTDASNTTTMLPTTRLATVEGTTTYFPFFTFGAACTNHSSPLQITLCIFVLLALLKITSH